MALDLSGPKNAGNNPPPARTPRPKSTAAQGRLADEVRQEREEALTGLFTMGGFIAMMAGQHADAGAAMTHGPKISHEAAALAENNAGVGKVIDAITAAGPYAGLLTAVMPFALQIMVNHKRLPAVPMLAQIGVVDPSVMEAQARAQAMQLQAEAIRTQRAAEDEIRQMEAELAATPEREPAAQ